MSATSIEVASTASIENGRDGVTHVTRWPPEPATPSAAAVAMIRSEPLRPSAAAPVWSHTHAASLAIVTPCIGPLPKTTACDAYMSEKPEPTSVIVEPPPRGPPSGMTRVSSAS